MSAAAKNTLFMLLLGSQLHLQAQSLHRVVASPLEAGSPAVVRFEWDNAGPIPAAWKMGMVLPREFNRSQLLMAASQRINGGFTAANRGDTLWVERSGTGDRISASEKMDLSVATIRLPMDLQKNYSFVCILQDSSRRVTFSGTMTLSRGE